MSRRKFRSGELNSEWLLPPRTSTPSSRGSRHSELSTSSPTAAGDVQDPATFTEGAQNPDKKSPAVQGFSDDEIAAARADRTPTVQRKYTKTYEPEWILPSRVASVRNPSSGQEQFARITRTASHDERDIATHEQDYSPSAAERQPPVTSAEVSIHTRHRQGAAHHYDLLKARSDAALHKNVDAPPRLPYIASDYSPTSSPSLE